ncbi:MAG: CotH kinase family protein [Bacteroidota bacterium]
MYRLIYLSLLGLFFGLNAIAQDLYSTRVIQEIRIEFDQQDWRFKLDSFKLAGTDRRIPATVIINGEVFETAGIRYRGSSSYFEGNAKNPFNIKLDYSDSTASYQGYRSIKLSNLTDDPTYIREVLAYEIARDYFPAPGANYVKVYVNDEYEGVYVNIESINKDFLTKHFESPEGNALYKCTPYTNLKNRPEGCLKGQYSSLIFEGKSEKCYEGIYEDKGKTGYRPLINLIEALEDGSTEKIEQLLDVERTLWMHAFNNVLVNLSSYSGKFSHNYYLYQQENGQFVPIIWDLNLAFGGFRSTGEGAAPTLDMLPELSPRLHSQNPEKPLISALMKHQKYQKMYQAYLRTILRDHFRSQTYLSEARILQSLIRPIILRDQNSYFDYAQFSVSLDQQTGTGDKAIPGLAPFMTQRTNFLRRHEDLTILYPRVEIKKVEPKSLPPNGDLVAYEIQVRIRNRPTSAELYYRIKGNNAYTPIDLLDDGQQDDGRAENGTYGARLEVKAGETIEYYIKANNKDATRFEPTNYLMQPLEISAAP